MTFRRVTVYDTEKDAVGDIPLADLAARIRRYEVLTSGDDAGETTED